MVPILIPSTLIEAAAITDEHRGYLLAAAPVYRRPWWPQHDRAIRGWIEDGSSRIRQTGSRPRERLIALLETQWFPAPVQIEIPYYGRTWTTLRPVVTTLAVMDTAYAAWAGGEMVFHEAVTP